MKSLLFLIIYNTAYCISFNFEIDPIHLSTMNTILADCDSESIYSFLDKKVYEDIERDGDDYVALKIINKSNHIYIVKMLTFWAEFISQTSYGYGCISIHLDTVFNLETPLQYSIIIHGKMKEPEINSILNNLKKCTCIDTSLHLKIINKINSFKYRITYSYDKKPYYLSTKSCEYIYEVLGKKVILNLDRIVYSDGDLDYPGSEMNCKHCQINNK